VSWSEASTGNAVAFLGALATANCMIVTTAEGVRVLHHPVLPWRPAEELDPDRRIDGSTLPPTIVGDRLDLSYAVAVLLQQAA